MDKKNIQIALENNSYPLQLCNVWPVVLCSSQRIFRLFIMFHHGTRGKAEDRTFLELRLQTVSLVGNLLTPVTSNVLFRYSMHICIHTTGHTNPLPSFAYLLLYNTFYLFASLFLSGFDCFVLDKAAQMDTDVSEQAVFLMY